MSIYIHIFESRRGTADASDRSVIVCVCTRICIYTYIYVPMCIYVYVYIKSCKYTYIHLNQNAGHQLLVAGASPCVCV